MKKTMTLTFVTAALAIGLGGSAFAATMRQDEGADRLEMSDPDAPPFAAISDCSIGGTYLGRSYCFGGEANGGVSYRERRAERLESRGAY